MTLRKAERLRDRYLVACHLWLLALIALRIFFVGV